jgi:hypothetical protein
MCLTNYLPSQSAWDSYIQGNGNAGIDNAQFWPMNLDLSMDGTQQQQQQTSTGGNANTGVFMGASNGSTML